MSNDGPDFSGVMRSPYDDDDQAGEGESEIPWKPPVIAAIVGALLVSAFVIYAIVSGPTEDSAQVSPTPVGTEAVRSSDIPPGFTAFPSGNGARIEAAGFSDEEHLVAVSTAVAGSDVPGEVAPDEIAYWELLTPAGKVTMDEQLSVVGALGNTTVVFGVKDVSDDSQLVAFVVRDAVETTAAIEVPVVEGSLQTEFSIDIEPGVTVDGVVTIGEGWGYVDWSLTGGVTAKLDTVVTFVGTDDPTSEGISETRLIPGHLRVLSQGVGAVESGPLYGYGGGYQLYRVGEPLSAANEPSSILIEFAADVVTAVSDPVVVGSLPEG